MRFAGTQANIAGLKGIHAQRGQSWRLVSVVRRNRESRNIVASCVNLLPGINYRSTQLLACSLFKSIVNIIIHLS